jgi:hypothetical protein
MIVDICDATAIWRVVGIDAARGSWLLPFTAINGDNYLLD